MLVGDASAPAPHVPPNRLTDPGTPASVNAPRRKTLAGSAPTLVDQKGKALLIVNVASQCGLTPQYTGLEALQKKYADRGLSVLGFPCNQFGGQEPGTAGAVLTTDVPYSATHWIL